MATVPARGRTSDLVPRIAVALPAIAYCTAMTVLGGWWFVAGIALLGLVCLHELFAMFARAHPVPLAGFVGFLGLLVAAELGGTDAVLGAAAACVPLVFVVALAQPRAGAPGVSVTLFALMWVGLGLAHAVLLRELEHGGGVVAAVAVGTFVGDTGAYLGGRLFGRRPLAPSISPNKTFEGLALGVVATLLGVQAVGLYQDWLSGGDALLLGLAVAAVAPLGDLFESYLKRDLEVKDAGRLFGAHGGALDRLDGIFFSAAAGYWVWLALL